MNAGEQNSDMNLKVTLNTILQIFSLHLYRMFHNYPLNKTRLKDALWHILLGSIFDIVVVKLTTHRHTGADGGKHLTRVPSVRNLVMKVVKKLVRLNVFAVPQSIMVV